MLRYWQRYRTIFLGTVATGLLVWSAISNFGIDWRDMLRLLGFSVLLLLVVLLLAASTVAVIVLCRKLLGRGED